MVKAVIFDIDGVLIDSFEANLKFFQDIMIKMGYPPITREEYKPLFHYTMLDVFKFIGKSDSDEKVQKMFEIGAKREVPYPLELLTSPEKMKETLELLSKNYFLGIVTSRIKNSVFESLIMQGIKNCFIDVVSFEDTEKHKPDPEPLLLAVSKLGIKPEEVVYIGDLETDLKAAKAAGVNFILFAKENNIGAKIFTDNFSQLPNLIKEL